MTTNTHHFSDAGFTAVATETDGPIKQLDLWLSRLREPSCAFSKPGPYDFWLHQIIREMTEPGEKVRVSVRSPDEVSFHYLVFAK